MKMENKENVATPTIVINNTMESNQVVSAQTGAYGATIKNKNTSLLLALLGFIGIGGIHKFYEGKPIMGLIYLFTFGLYGIGTIIDILALLAKPNKYIV
jgi:restriction system protein